MNDMILQLESLQHFKFDMIFENTLYDYMVSYNKRK